jgi:hypothetical protein
MSIVINKRPNHYNFTGNPVRYELYSSAAAADPDIYFEIKIRFTPTNNIFFTDSLTIPVYPVSGKATIDIKDILNSVLSFVVPVYDNTDTKKCTAADGQVGLFYIQFREVDPDAAAPAFDNSEYPANVFVIVKGGISYLKFRGDNFWNNYFNGNNPFLTWQQSGRLAAYNEKMWLAFLNTSDLPSWSVPEVVGPTLWAGVKVYYTDGTSSAIQFHDTENPDKNEITLVPCGAIQWNLNALDPSKKIWYWEVGMYYTSAPDGTKTLLNTPFKFYQDNRNDYNDVTLHYRNSLGGFDSVRVRGVIEKNIEYSFSQHDVTVDPEYYAGDKIAGRTKIAVSKESLIYKGDIGYLGKEEQDRLRDMHLLREVWWKRDNKWHPVILLTGNQRLTGTDDQLFSMPLEFMLADGGDNYYTPDAVNLGDE